MATDNEICQKFYEISTCPQAEDFDTSVWCYKTHLSGMEEICPQCWEAFFNWLEQNPRKRCE